MRFHLLSGGQSLWSFRLDSLGLNKSQLIRKTENPFHFTTGVTRLLSRFYLHGYYAGLLVYPADLSAEYSFNCLPMVESLDDPRLLGALTLYVMLGALCVLSYRASRPEDRRSVFLALCWLGVPFLPAANVLFTVGTLVAERLLYLPSIGYCLLLARGLEELGNPLRYGFAHKHALGHAFPVRAAVGGLSRKGRSRAAKGRSAAAQAETEGSASGSHFAVALLALLLAYYAHGTWTRNLDWASDETLFRAGVRTCPTSAKMHSQLAHILLNKLGDDPAATGEEFDLIPYTLGQQSPPSVLPETRMCCLGCL
jgi:hypothetical protein